MYDEFDDENFVDKNWEFNKVLNDLINLEVKQRVSEIYAEHEANKAALKECQDNLHKNNAMLTNLKNAHSKEIEHAIRQAKNETKREIFGGYKVGDKAFIIKTNPTAQKCGKCNKGNVEVIIDGVKTTAKCPHCRYGSIFTYTYELLEVTVSQTEYKEWAKERCKELRYWVVPDRGESREVWLKDIYPTKEDCQKACDERILKDAEKQKTDKIGEG